MSWEVVGKNYLNGRNIRIEIEKEVIVGVYPFQTDMTLPFVAPGLVDLQVNGYSGVDLNTKGLIEEDIYQMVESLFTQGVTSFLPTVITNSSERIKQILKVILSACKKYPLVDSAVLGIHLEGPFLSKQEGPRGAHDSGYMQAPNWALFEDWQKAAGGKIKLITLSPEWEGTGSFIEKSVQSGVKVSIGHTAANQSQIQKAIDSGATLSTHLGNGCHQYLPRYPNYIWNQLAADQLWASLIADGFHLPYDVLKVFLKVKQDRAFLVSDTTHLAGLPAGAYDTHIGSKVILDENGRLYMKDNPSALAGSAQSLLWCVNHLVKSGLRTLPEAWNLASLKPAEYFKGAATPAFKVGAKADLVLFEWLADSKALKVKQSFKAGKVVYG